MKILVPLVFVFLAVGFWLAVDQTSNLGRLPSDEEVIVKQERNKVTGELLNVQIIRCTLCGQVCSYVQFHQNGKVAQGYRYYHRCGQYHERAMVPPYNGSATSSPLFGIVEWLGHWQRRLRLKR